MKDATRITTRVPHRVMEKLQEAADLSGATVNQFVVRVALKRAEEIIERETIIRMTKADAAKLLEMLENPPAPNEKLLAAFQRHCEIESTP